ENRRGLGKNTTDRSYKTYFNLTIGEQNMIPHKLTLCLLCILFIQVAGFAQQKPPAGGRLAVVVDERLAALRAAPQLSGKLVRRLSRGRLVAVRSSKTNTDGITFVLVNVSSRT